MKSYAMRFISGKYQGGEFPLPANSEIIVGRSSELDMVLVEDMVSRRHAKIVVNGDQVVIQDLGSTNGTFVNGERIKKMALNDGDRVLIGTSIIKLVTADPGSIKDTRSTAQDLEEVAAHRRSTQGRSMSGAIDEVPLPDLLQLFGSSRKTGVLVIKTDTDVGKVYLEKGSIVFASVNDNLAMTPEKSVFRILAWRHGTFYLEPSEQVEVDNRVDLSVEATLMEGMRIVDEVHRAELPSMHSTISVPSPLDAKLSKLTPDQLDVFQVAMHQKQLEAVFNNCGIDDIKIAAALEVLLKGSYILAKQP
jgi:pSer/pThr/pTyr-binding forkhead associated (FHA) protein